MAQANIHPDYHSIIMKFPSGLEIKTRSTFGKENEVMVVEIDIASHPAWREDGANAINEKSSAVAKFRSKYGNVNLAELMSSKTES